MSLLVPIVFVIFAWWFSTGAVLWLSTRTHGSRANRLKGMLALGGLGILGVVISGYPDLFRTGEHATYLGFLSALAVWALVEFTFLTGIVTGPRIRGCPPGVDSSERFRLAYQAMSHHEYALAATLGLIGIITLPGGHATAFATFFLLWLMRLSAKLTLFSGAPKFASDMMPPTIAHLQSYIRSDRIGPVFWLSMVVSNAVFTAAIIVLVSNGLPKDYELSGVMLTTLLGLGVLEHWFMILPVADSALWRWALPGPRKARTNLQEKTKTCAKKHTLLLAQGYNAAGQDRRGAVL
ncbi:MAG: putative photosynthetic complex assembly protein PuhE [Sphingomonadales bacterium]